MSAIRRWGKILFAAYAICFAATLLVFLLTLFLAGPEMAEKVWGPLVMVPLFGIAIPFAAKYLK